MLTNVTAIIPAHNRPERLRRLLDYFQGTGIHVLVPDSSTLEFPHVSDYPGVIYLHQPRMHFLDKIHQVLPHISTPYVFYCADDDFTVPESVDNIITFMDRRPDVASVQGHYLTFRRTGSKVSFSPRYIRNFNKQIVADTACGRFAQYHDLYASNLYGITRSHIFKRMYSVCFDADGKRRFSNLFLAELYYNYFTLIHGNYVTLPLFFSAREEIPHSATSTVTPFSEIASNPQYHDEYQGFISTLAEELAEVDSIDTDSARSEIIHLIEKPKFGGRITFMQQLAYQVTRHSSALPLLSDLMAWRYRQKGLKAVRGMASYPCTFSTPQTRKIIGSILNT